MLYAVSACKSMNKLKNTEEEKRTIHQKLAELVVLGEIGNNRVFPELPFSYNTGPNSSHP